MLAPREQSESHHKRSHVAGEILSLWNQFLKLITNGQKCENVKDALCAGIVGQEEGWGSLEESSMAEGHSCCRQQKSKHVRKTIVEPDCSSTAASKSVHSCMSPGMSRVHFL